MQLHTGQVLELLDAQGRLVGRMTLDGHEDDLLLGQFTPGLGFPAVARLFRDFEEAADVQALGVIENLAAAVAALGLHLRPPTGEETIAVNDVQIWSDGGMTCRLSNSVSVVEGLNGNIQAEAPGQLQQPSCSPSSST